MFLQAAGYPDVVDTQEAAAGEGDIPGGVWGEHGFRAPLNAGVGGGGRERRGSRGAPLTSHRPGAGGTEEESRESLLRKDAVTSTARFAAGLLLAAAELI